MKLKIIHPQSHIKISSVGVAGRDGAFFGSNGTSGINGSNGTSGTIGPAGSSGTSGINGSNGTSGVNGTSGLSGTSGVNGTSGLTQNISHLATTGSNTFKAQQIVSGSILLSGSLIPATANGTFTSSFSLGSSTNAWKDLWISQGSIIFVDAVTQQTSSFTITANQEVQYSSGITASYYEGDGSRLYNLPSNTNWNKDKAYILRNTEQLTFSGDYILENCALMIEGGNEEVEYSPNKSFKKEGSLFIGGNLLLKDSYIVNDGKIKVDGEVILIGNSHIEGTGIII